ncbi:MAG: M23 family metallopeptidase [Synechococcus sp.]
MPVALLVPALQLLNPMAGVVTQDVRPGHPAIDIACTVGTPVHAAHDGIGRVERSYTHGITFVLAGEDGLQTSYSHLNSAQAAGRYSRGDLIGTCGNTGIWTSGPHLHFESNRPELLSNLASPTIPSKVPAAMPVAAIGGSPMAIKQRP